MPHHQLLVYVYKTISAYLVGFQFSHRFHLLNGKEFQSCMKQYVLLVLQQTLYLNNGIVIVFYNYDQLILLTFSDLIVTNRKTRVLNYWYHPSVAK